MYEYNILAVCVYMHIANQQFYQIIPVELVRALAAVALFVCKSNTHTCVCVRVSEVNSEHKTHNLSVYYVAVEQRCALHILNKFRPIKWWTI